MGVGTRSMVVMGLLALVGCRGGEVDPPTAESLERGGVYVAYNNGCAQGCNELARGDLIVAVDGKPVQSRPDLLAASLTSTQPVTLDVLPPREDEPKKVVIRARPNHQFAPVENAPPFWTVGSEALARTPEWARAPMYSHAVPAMGFLHVDGGWVTGRDLHGRKSLIVVWPDLPMFERQYWNFRDQMATFYGVLQKAQADLEAQGVDIMFAVCGGANDTTVRKELLHMSQRDREGKPLPPLPVFRCPDLARSDWSPGGGKGQLSALGGGSPSRRLGLENSAQHFFHYTRGFPAVVLVDRGGIVRWHSSGYHEGPQNTILSAVVFALEQLDAE